MAALPCPRETQRGAGDRGRNRGGHEIGIGVWSRSAAWRSRPRCMRFHYCEIRACTGASLAEISGLEVQDVDLQEMTINIRFNATRRLKNDPSVRTVPVVDKRAIEALRVRIAGRRPTDAVFPRSGREEDRTVRRVKLLSRKREVAEQVWKLLPAK